MFNRMLQSAHENASKCKFLKACTLVPGNLHEQYANYDEKNTCPFAFLQISLAHLVLSQILILAHNIGSFSKRTRL